jgi:ketosteroid isomerase-like protein
MTAIAPGTPGPDPATGTCAEVVRRYVETLEARDWDAWTALLDPDVVYEVPQSRERVRGRERYLRFNREYPEGWHLRVKQLVADGSPVHGHGVLWLAARMGDAAEEDAVVFLTVAGGLVTRVTDFWPEPYDPPLGREHLVERW